MIPEDELKQSVKGVVDKLGKSANVLVYGSWVRGGFDEALSDLNILIASSDISYDALKELTSILLPAFHQKRVQPFLVSEREIAEAADVFPLKFLGIKKYHKVLFGKDPLLETKINGQHLRYRIEQELRNAQMRLRKQIVFAQGNDPYQLSEIVAQKAKIVAFCAEGLFTLLGQKNIPSTNQGLFEAICSEVDIQIQNESGAKVLDQLDELLRRLTHQTQNLKVNGDVF